MGESMKNRKGTYLVKCDLLRHGGLRVPWWPAEWRLPSCSITKPPESRMTKRQRRDWQLCQLDPFHN